MPRYLISFDDGSMDHISAEDLSAVIEVPTRADALDWAARIAAGCRCAQEVREITFDPAS